MPRGVPVKTPKNSLPVQSYIIIKLIDKANYYYYLENKFVKKYDSILNVDIFFQNSFNSRDIANFVLDMMGFPQENHGQKEVYKKMDLMLLNNLAESGHDLTELFGFQRDFYIDLILYEFRGATDKYNQLLNYKNQL